MKLSDFLTPDEKLRAIEILGPVNAAELDLYNVSGRDEAICVVQGKALQDPLNRYILEPADRWREVSVTQ